MVNNDEGDRRRLTPLATDKLPVGRTLGDTFRVIGRGWPKFYGLSLIVLLVSLPFAVLFAQQMGDILVRAADPLRTDLPPAVPGQSSWGRLGAFYAVQIVVTLYAFTAMSNGAAAMLASGRVDFGASLKAGVTRFLPMLVAAVTFYVGLIIGFVLLAVPGIIFGAAYGLAPALAVIERRGPFASFSRSAELTRGNRWRCIGVTLILLAVPAIVFAIVGQIITRSLGQQYSLIITTLINFFLLPIYYVYPAVLAYELRRLREGGAPSAVADVF